LSPTSESVISRPLPGTAQSWNCASTKMLMWWGKLLYYSLPTAEVRVSYIALSTLHHLIVDQVEFSATITLKR
jgi:hypothetical protein